MKINQASDLQIKLVRELHWELKEITFKVLPSQKSSEIDFIPFSIKKIADLVEGDSELSEERFDDDRVLFANNTGTIFPFNRFKDTGLLPAEILNIVNVFHNVEYKKVTPKGHPFFVIMNNETDDQGGYNTGELYLGDGKAFLSWVSFKETADNLAFVIRNWLDQNSGFLGRDRKIKNKISF